MWVCVCAGPLAAFVVLSPALIKSSTLTAQREQAGDGGRPAIQTNECSDGASQKPCGTPAWFMLCSASQWQRTGAYLERDDLRHANMWFVSCGKDEGSSMKCHCWWASGCVRVCARARMCVCLCAHAHAHAGVWIRHADILLGQTFVTFVCARSEGYDNPPLNLPYFFSLAFHFSHFKFSHI